MKELSRLEKEAVRTEESVREEESGRWYPLESVSSSRTECSLISCLNFRSLCLLFSNMCMRLPAEGGKEWRVGRKGETQSMEGEEMSKAGFSLTHNCTEGNLFRSLSLLTLQTLSSLHPFIHLALVLSSSLSLLILLPPTLVVLRPFFKEVRKGRRGFEHLHVRSSSTLHSWYQTFLKFLTDY